MNTYCGIANIADAQFCKACAARIGVPVAPVMPTVTQAMAQTARLPLKSPFTAGALSWLWPGLGCCYVGLFGRGFAQAILIPLLYAVIACLAFIAAALGNLGAILFLLVVVVCIFWAVICDAADQARRVNVLRENARALVRAARAAG